MRMRVSTNRGGWQMHGKSNVKAEPRPIFLAKAHSGWVLGRCGLNHNQKLRPLCHRKPPLLV
jgi:hypothetical protein